MLPKSHQNKTASTTPKKDSKPLSIMSSDTTELIRKHFTALDEEEEEFTSSHSRTQSQLPGQLEAKEARELEEALRLSAQEAMEERKRKKKTVHKAPQEVGEPSTASVTPKKRKASSCFKP